MYDKVFSVMVSNDPSDIQAWKAVALEPRIVACGGSREAAESNLMDKVERAYPDERVHLHVECISESF